MSDAAPTASGVTRFGPGALATPANVVTGMRFALTVPLLGLISADGAGWGAFAGWVALGGTDGLDGWLARRDGTTRSGAFLDPLADKFLALGGLAVLADRGTFPWAVVLVIAGREVAVSAWRTAAGRRGVSLPARRLGKLKTLSQLVAVGCALCPATARTAVLAGSVLGLAAVLTVVSGADLVLAARRRSSVAAAA